MATPPSTHVDRHAPHDYRRTPVKARLAVAVALAIPTRRMVTGFCMYHSFTTIGDARLQHPYGTLVMDADFGGQMLLSCPVPQIRASQKVILQLHADLEMITWGPGFDPTHHETSDEARIYLVDAPAPIGLPSGMGGGAATGELWLHDELEEELQLRRQIEQVLSGLQPRLFLPEGFPEAPLRTIAEAKLYPLGRVVITAGWTLVDCHARIVQVPETVLRQLGEYLKDIITQPKIGFRSPPMSAEPAVTFWIRTMGLDWRYRTEDLYLLPDPHLKPLRDKILRILQVGFPALPGATR